MDDEPPNQEQEFSPVSLPLRFLSTLLILAVVAVIFLAPATALVVETWVYEFISRNGTLIYISCGLLLSAFIGVIIWYFIELPFFKEPDDD